MTMCRVEKRCLPHDGIFMMNLLVLSVPEGPSTPLSLTPSPSIQGHQRHNGLFVVFRVDVNQELWVYTLHTVLGIRDSL